MRHSLALLVFLFVSIAWADSPDIKHPRDTAKECRTSWSMVEQAMRGQEDVQVVHLDPMELLKIWRLSRAEGMPQAFIPSGMVTYQNTETEEYVIFYLDGPCVEFLVRLSKKHFLDLLGREV